MNFLKENPTFYLATVDGYLPRVRPIGFAMWYNGHLCLGIGKHKAAYKQLLDNTIAVGDGANDLPMISEAGLGIAFHAKPRVVANASQSINTMGLDGVLYFLGFKDSYLDSLSKD